MINDPTQEEINRVRQELLAQRGSAEQQIRTIDENLAALASTEAILKKFSGHVFQNRSQAGSNEASERQGTPKSSPGHANVKTKQIEMVLNTVTLSPEGANRATIAEYILARYGVQLSPAHVSTYLSRLKEATLVRLQDGLWLPVSNRQSGRKK